MMQEFGVDLSQYEEMDALVMRRVRFVYHTILLYEITVKISAMLEPFPRIDLRFTLIRFPYTPSVRQLITS